MNTLLLLFACHHRPEPQGESGADTAADSDSGEPPGETVNMPWTEEGFWTNPGPLATLLQPDADDDTLNYIVRIATSADFVTWELTELTPASNFSSIDLFILPDVGVVILGMPDAPMLPLETSSVYALVSADLETWGSVSWPIPTAAHPNLVDPALHWSPDGRLALSYYATDTFGVDPVSIPGDHEVRKAYWGMNGWEEEDRVLFQAEGLVDPMFCQQGGEEVLVTTQNSVRVIGARENDEGTFTQDDALTWKDRTVPFCRAEGDSIRVLSQGFGAFELPRYAEITDAGLTDKGELYSEAPFPEGNCSSAVYGSWKGQYILVCAVRKSVYTGEGS